MRTIKWKDRLFMVPTVYLREGGWWEDWGDRPDEIPRWSRYVAMEKFEDDNGTPRYWKNESGDQPTGRVLEDVRWFWRPGGFDVDGHGRRVKLVEYHAKGDRMIARMTNGEIRHCFTNLSTSLELAGENKWVELSPVPELPPERKTIRLLKLRNY